MSWKESKIFIAASTCAATIGFLVLIFFTVIIPTWLESYKNEIKELKKATPDYPEIVKKLNEKKGTLRCEG